jgi:hypothetical protein
MLWLIRPARLASWLRFGDAIREGKAALADRKDDCHAIKKTTGDKLSFILAILLDREPRCSAWSIRSTAEVRGTYSIRDRF